MSRRVFTVGGGLAPGVNGGSIPNGEAPVSITTPAGSGVPGGWSGSNRKYSTAEKQQIQSEQEESKAIANSIATTSSTAKSNAAAVNEAVATIQTSARGVNTTIMRQALKTAQEQAKLAKANATLAEQYSAQVTTLTQTAATTDNTAVRIESNLQAKEAADKAKYYATLSENNKKAADSAVSVAKAEEARYDAEQAARAAAAAAAARNRTTGTGGRRF